MRAVMLVAAMSGSALLSGCVTNGGPLVFGKANTFGASVSATAPDQGGTLTVGYRSANIAIVPVVVVDAEGRAIKTEAVIRDKTHGVATDAYSTFAHFETNSQLTGKVCLGDTFATGLAAQKVAQGLAKMCP